MLIESVDLGVCAGDAVPCRGLLSLYKEGRYTDVTFYVEEHTFKAHRVIVASQSPFFDRQASIYWNLLPRVHAQSIKK